MRSCGRLPVGLDAPADGGGDVGPALERDPTLVLEPESRTLSARRRQPGSSSGPRGPGEPSSFAWCTCRQAAPERAGPLAPRGLEPRRTEPAPVPQPPVAAEP